MLIKTKMLKNKDLSSFQTLRRRIYNAIKMFMSIKSLITPSPGPTIYDHILIMKNNKLVEYFSFLKNEKKEQHRPPCH